MVAFHIQCIVYSQRANNDAPVFALFAAPAKEMLKWAAIRRRSEDPEGPQRKLSKAKINSIKRFFISDSRNAIPPAVTVTLDISENNIKTACPGKEGLESLKVLSFQVDDNITDEHKPGLVIDGQHRLIGMSEIEDVTMVNVVALLNVGDMEKAFQFLVINNKAMKVPSDHIRTLALDYEKAELAERLRTARLTLNDNLKYVGIMNNDESSPFKGLISLVTHEGDEESRYVTPAAIESAIGVIQKKKVREFESDDALLDFFYAIWWTIRENWQELWCDGSKLMSKAGIVAMTAYMTEGLISKYDWNELDITNPDDVKDMVEKIIASQTSEIWKAEWNIRISDAKIVRDKIVEALTTVARNIRTGNTWSEDVEIVSL